MERTTSLALLNHPSHRRVTRNQISIVKKTFPFLSLPPELRNMIYEYCISTDPNLKSFFDKYHTKLCADRTKPMPVPKIAFQNNIFLLNTDIYNEAKSLVQNQSVLFDHGLFKIKRLESVISPCVLQNLTSVEISDAGHPMIKGDILPESWHGYMRLFQQLSDVFSRGHKLKSFTIDFTDDRMREHMTTCWHANNQCGFRDQIIKATNYLRAIRGVKTVTINGINEDHARKLKAHMESTPTVFLDLPREVRDQIYEYAVDWNVISDVLAKKAAQKNKRKQKKFPHTFLTTPSLLLANKQIYAEATEALHKKPLAITFPAGHKIHNPPEGVPRMLSNFISAPTLQKVKDLTLTIPTTGYLSACLNKDFINVLATSPSLETLTIDFRDEHKRQIVNDAAYFYPDRQVHDFFVNLVAIRGLKKVSFHGDLPRCYTAPLVKWMTGKGEGWGILPKMFVEDVNGDKVEMGFIGRRAGSAPF